VRSCSSRCSGHLANWIFGTSMSNNLPSLPSHGQARDPLRSNRALSLPHAPVSWSLLSPSTSISEICSCGSAPAGDGRMSEALKVAGCARVYSTDITECGYAGQDEILVFLAGLELKLPSRFPGWDHHESSIRQAGQARRGTHRSRASALSRRPCPLVGAAASERFRFRQDSTALLRGLP
jgi:hypothetical protein